MKIDWTAVMWFLLGLLSGVFLQNLLIWLFFWRRPPTMAVRSLYCPGQRPGEGPGE